MNKLRINVFMYGLLFLMISTWILDLFTYLFNINYIVGLILSLGLTSILHFLIHKKINITLDIKKEDIIFFVLLGLIFIITIVYPDRSFDTINYHLYLQENPFGNKITFDFFAGKNLNSFSYAFPDRLFYIFRFILGYRLGVVLNYLIVIALYYMVKDIIGKLTKMKELPLVIISSLIVTTVSVIDIVDSYYIDLVSLVILFEAFRIIFTSKLDGNNNILYGYIGLLFGLAFAAKISNAFTLIGLFIIFIIKNRTFYKTLNIKNILITLLMFILPFSIYMIYTYISTGNPFFPFYNTIFKSEYFGLWNWMDTRFGPHSFIETILWPIIGALRPGRVNDQAIVEPLWAYGYIISIMYVGYYLFKYIRKENVNKEKLGFFLSTILIYLLWSKFQLGYSRYGLIALVLGGIAIYTYIYDIFKNKKILLISLIIPLMLYNFTVNVRHYMSYSEDWIFNNYFNDVTGEYKFNLTNLFSRGNEEILEMDKDSVWTIFYCNAGLAQMVNPNIPIINVANGADNDYTKEIMNDKIDNASHIYTLVDSLDLANFIDSINNYDFKIVSVKQLTSSILKRKTAYIYVFELVRGESKHNFDIFEGVKKLDVSDKDNIRFYLGLSKDSNRDVSSVNVTLKCNNNEIDKVVVHNDGMIKIDKNVSDCNTFSITSNTWLMTLDEE